MELNAAAIAGKTLSELQAEIHSWNEYDEPEPGSEDLAAHGAEEHEDEIYYTHEAQQEYSGIDEQAAPGDAAKISARDQSQVPAHDVHNVQQGIINPPDDSTSVSAERAVEAVSVSNTGSPAQLLDSEQRGQPEQSEQIAAENAHQHDDVHDDIPEEHYDSEGPQSDSTATIAGFIVEKGVKQEPQDVSPEITEAAAEQNEHENHYPEDVENDDLGPDEYREEEHITSLEDLESSHTDIAGLENDDVGTPKPADETHILDQEDEDELDAPPTNELVSGTPLQNKNIDPSHDQTASLPGSGLQAPSDNNHQTPEPAEDFFEIAEDFLQTPPRGTEHDDLDHFEGIDYEDPNDELATPDAADGEGINHDGFDGAHFGAYDTEFEESEAVELVGEDHSVTNSPKNSSTKRSREDEDHWDAVETTVDTKRRRSS